MIDALEARMLFASIRFAVVGDYGLSGQRELDVANMIKSFNPDFITTLGDNNYPTGGADTIDVNIGQYYHDYIYNYQGTFGAGSPTRRFFPTLGNHDWGDAYPNPTGANPYLSYFDLPTSNSGGERYYDFVAGPVHFFMLDSDPNEPSGRTQNSVQAQWLQAALASSTSPHNVVMLHHAPYSSSSHGSDAQTQWPYSLWGATAVFAGHDHSYERLFAEGVPYFVDGLGGRDPYDFSTPVAESQFRYNADNGAMIIDADDAQMTFKFYRRDGVLIDTSTLALANRLPIVNVLATDNAASESGQLPATFTISRARADLQLPLNVNFTLTGTAANGVDFTSIPLSATIPIGATSTTVQINPIDDLVAEGPETLTLTITSSGAFNPGHDKSASITISDDDGTSAQLLAGGSSWRYLDDGSNQGTAWRAPGFNDSLWSLGNARFGYGDPGMITTINGGPSNARITTHYFRTSFNIANANAIGEARLNVLRDDGAVIYLNGVELWRTNMPAGSVSSSTFASTSVGGADETTFFQHNFDASLLHTGSNTLAVELHQANLTTSDAVFDIFIAAGLDNVAPSVSNKLFDFDAWHALRFTFSEDVAASLDANDLTVTDLATNIDLPAGSFTLNTAGDRTIAIWRAINLLPDGFYRATLPASGVRDRAGNNLSAPVVLNFRVFRGDADGNGTINFDDYARIDNGFNNHLIGFSNGDFNYDGVVNFDDYAIIDFAFNSQNAFARSRRISHRALLEI